MGGAFAAKITAPQGAFNRRRVHLTRCEGRGGRAPPGAGAPAARAAARGPLLDQALFTHDSLQKAWAVVGQGRRMANEEWVHGEEGFLRG
jgi:hypothetical protein